MAQLSGSARWVWGFGALAGLAASLILLAWELRGLRRREPSLVLHEGQTGVVTVAVDMVRRLAEREAGTVPGVYASHCSVRDGRLGLRVRCALDLDLDAEVPSVSEKVQRRVKESLERQLGFVVEVVAVHSSAPGGRGLSRGRIR